LGTITETAAARLREVRRVMTAEWRAGREAEASVRLGDDHPEEALLAQEGPGLLREVTALDDLPVVGEAAQLLAGAVDEGALARRQLFSA